jgi:cation diffusion facilitator family transporter
MQSSIGESQHIAQKNIRIQGWIILIGIMLFGVKISAWLLTGSNSILTDALESLVNITAGAFGLYSLYLAAQPRDENHPYGHGKIEWISASLEGSMVLIAGISVSLKAIYNLFYPVDLTELNTGLFLIGFAGLTNGLMGYIVFQRGKKVHSVTLQASGRHLMSDGWSTLGLITGLALVIFSGYNGLDNGVAILFGIYISYSGIRILRKSLAGIMDEMDYPLLEKLSVELNYLRSQDFIDIHNLRIIQYGSLIHVDCHITVPWFLTVEQAHNLVAEIESKIKTLDGRPVEWFIHVDGCHTGSCRICERPNCPERKQAFEKRLEWNSASILPNQNHGRYEVLP